MNKLKLNRVFQQIKAETKMDYAITNADDYGDCSTCVNYEIADIFGVGSKGIYTKHWLRGINAGVAWKYLDGVYIGHDITEEQAAKMITIFKANGYDIQPEVYDASKAFFIKEL